MSLSVFFTKYSATGNDFIVIDNRELKLPISSAQLWRRWCDRRWGVGADGILFLEQPPTGLDFRMRYVNGADGEEAEMCGNGARALSHFAQSELGLGRNHQPLNFQTQCGFYQAIVNANMVELKMTELKDEGRFNLNKFGFLGEKIFVNTGVPHAVFEVENLGQFPVEEIGKKIRNDDIFERGTNVNFFEKQSDGTLKMRTFERGVEAETLACGTGAVALAYLVFKRFPHRQSVAIEVPGGKLLVKYDDLFKNVWLCGEVKKIFIGEIECSLR